MPTRNVTEGFPVFFDSTDAGLPASSFTTFRVTGGSLRTAYRTGYAFNAPGPHVVTVDQNVEFTVKVKPYVPTSKKKVRAGTTEDKLEQMMSEGGDLVWDDDAVVTLTRVLSVGHKDVRWVNAKLVLGPKTADHSVFVDVFKPGFRVQGLTVTGKLTWPWVKSDKGTADVFHVRNGGSLVCTGKISVRGVDTFCYATLRHGGIVVEGANLTDIRKYVLYQNAGSAGTSFWNCKVEAVANEPFFRVMEKDPTNDPSGNIYVGGCQITRRWDDAKPFKFNKDGLTPRGGFRFAGDSNVIRNCQIRSGQDDAAVAEGNNPDPHDLLFYKNKVTRGYFDHKKGSRAATRIHVIKNQFETLKAGDPPKPQSPMSFSGTTDSVVTDNVWIGGSADWKPDRANDNVNLKLGGNSNVVPPG